MQFCEQTITFSQKLCENSENLKSACQYLFNPFRIVKLSEILLPSVIFHHRQCACEIYQRMSVMLNAVRVIIWSYKGFP